MVSLCFAANATRTTLVPWSARAGLNMAWKPEPEDQGLEEM